MAVCTVYQHGIKAGIAPGKTDSPRAKRSSVSGWSSKTSRSNLDFLRSVQLEKLSGLGHAFTLTVRDCPNSPTQWRAMRDSYFKRIRRMKFYRVHWVTEWQRRGVPHLHGVAFYREPVGSYEYSRQHGPLIDHWLAVCKEYGAESHGQKVTYIDDALGWLKYLAKHASRAASHDQRGSHLIPEEWQKKTGRMWGKLGEWPVVPGEKVPMDEQGFYLFRRVMRNYRKSDARACGSDRRLARIRSARTMLRCNKENHSRVRGVSEWMPEQEQRLLLEWIRTQGWMVRGYFGRDFDKCLLNTHFTD